MVFVLTSTSFITAQNVQSSQSVIDTLCSSYFSGRGYVNDGDIRAATYIAEAFKDIGLIPLKGDSYFHNFKLNVNTFPGEVEIKSGSGNLTPGFDYIIAPDAPSIATGDMTVRLIDKTLLLDKKRCKKIIKLDWKKNVLLIDTLTHNKTTKKRLEKLLKKYTNPVILYTQKKLTWSVSRTQNSQVKITCLPGVLKDEETISVHIEASLVNGYETRNVVGYIPGNQQPDSFIFITGHYDHLGMMGQNCIMPGANDNASGIAMMLDFAKHYVENPPRYSIVFIGFAAEEAGLVGSYFFVSELKQYVTPSNIRFVVNMDLMGSGQEGIMAVNGSILPTEYGLLKDINTEKDYLPQTKKRGKAANSDHYFFTENGIPAFFFYLMGPYSHYHDVEDTRENLRLDAKSYNGAFLLIRDFIDVLMNE